MDRRAEFIEMYHKRMANTGFFVIALCMLFTLTLQFYEDLEKYVYSIDSTGIAGAFLPLPVFMGYLTSLYLLLVLIPYYAYILSELKETMPPAVNVYTKAFEIASPLDFTKTTVYTKDIKEIHYKQKKFITLFYIKEKRRFFTRTHEVAVFAHHAGKNVEVIERQGIPLKETDKELMFPVFYEISKLLRG